MRRLVVASAAVTILALTGVTAFTASGGLAGSNAPGATDPTQNRQVRSGGVAGGPQGGLLHRSGNDVFAKGDMTGSGGGGKRGGMMGDMMGSMGQAKGKGKS